MRFNKTIITAVFVCALLVCGATDAAAKTDAEALQNTVTAVGEEAAKAVVQIRVIRNNEQPYKEIPSQNSFFSTRNMAPGYNSRPYGPCTGVMIDKEGHILTSHFNIEGDIKKITVTLGSGERHEAKLLGRSEVMDIALLKITGDFNTKDYLKLKSPKEKPRLGAYVIVVSRTVNIRQHSLTFGIISAIDRLRPEIAAMQIDAKVNYGNSGAPALNLRGNFIGLVGFVRDKSAKMNNPTGQSSGIGFANTADKIIAILKDLKAGKIITAPKSPFLGVSFEPTYTKGDGVLIREVHAGSAAADAGLEAGDLIIEFDGK